MAAARVPVLSVKLPLLGLLVPSYNLITGTAVGEVIGVDVGEVVGVAVGVAVGVGVGRIRTTVCETDWVVLPSESSQVTVRDVVELVTAKGSGNLSEMLSPGCVNVPFTLLPPLSESCTSSGYSSMSGAWILPVQLTVIAAPALTDCGASMMGPVMVNGS